MVVGLRVGGATELYKKIVVLCGTEGRQGQYMRLTGVAGEHMRTVHDILYILEKPNNAEVSCQRPRVKGHTEGCRRPT